MKKPPGLVERAAGGEEIIIAKAGEPSDDLNAGPGWDEMTDLMLPADDVDAVLVLLTGVIAQALRDGVLPPVGALRRAARRAPQVVSGAVLE